YSTSAALSLPLYTGGRVAGQVRGEREGGLATGKDAETGLSNRVLETITAFLDLVTSRESERVLAESIKSYEADLKQVRDRAEVGMAARNDVLNVQVERDQAELDRLQAANRAAIANENLVRLLGIGPGSRVEPTESVTAATPADEPVEALVAKALDDRPEIAGLRARVAAADAAVKDAGSARLPQASLDGAYEYARPNVRVLPLRDTWNDSWRVGVNVAFQAFDGGRTSAAVAQARAQAEAVRRQFDDLERHVRLD